MNQLNDLLAELHRLQIKLWLDDGKVQVSAPKGSMTPALREQMMRHRDDIRTFLGQQNVEQTIQPAPRNGTAPLSYAQQQLWFLMNLDGGSAAYNLPTALLLKGVLNVTALEESLRQIFVRHEVLRTTFPLVDGAPVQQIEAQPATYAIEQVDLSHVPAGEQIQTVQQIIDDEANVTFDLEHGPLTVAKLFRLNEQSHVLFFNQHHIVIDGWSTGILVHEFSTLYEALIAEKEADLPPLSVQYADYAIWQNEWLQGQSYQERLAYWVDQLAGAPGLLELPTDHVRPAVQSTNGSAFTQDLPAELVEQILAFSSQQGISTQMTMMAAYLVLLARYSGSADLVVGVPVANRNLPELEPLIGFFVNTIPVRITLNHDWTFAELLAHVKETMLAAYARQDVPFDQIVERVRPERSLSYAPIYQVVFNYLAMSGDDLELPDLSIEFLEAESRTARHDLTMDVNVVDDEIGISWQFSTDLFTAQTVARMDRHYQAILQAGLAAPTQTIAHLPLLTAAERTMMLEDWNATAADFPLHLPVHELISRHAQSTPDAEALIFTDRNGVDHCLTFAEYDAQANQLAHYLQQQGVTNGTMVGICANRSLEVMVGILAVMKSGGVYVPLDPDYPQDRLEQSIADSGMVLLLTQSHLEEKLDWSDVPRFYMDADWHKVAEQPRSALLKTSAIETNASETSAIETSASEKSAAEDGIYLIFTSGSTGRPKGVLAAHRGVANLALALGQEIRVQTGDRLLQFAPFSFDASALQMFVPLVNGGTLVLHHDPTKLSAQELMDYAAQQKMTILDLPAALWRQWVADMKDLTLRLPSTVRFFLTGGEAVPAETLRQWSYLSPREVQFLSSYGPTEASITTTIFRSSNNELAEVQEADLTIGRPLPNTSVYLLDEQMNPVPIGVHGEIYIGGVGVTKGYFNDPELTAAKFVANPFAEGLLYRTGDWGRFRPNGDIEFLGRMDNQVKIRGFRIELGEIEAVLNQHPFVQEAIVTAPADENGRKQLAAYLVPTADVLNLTDGSSVEIDRAELRNYVAAHLPQHMVPAAFVQLDAIPILPNGKVDRKALPTPTAESLTRTHEYAAPTTETEEKLAEIWQSLLNVEAVGLHDNFFELGGDSILGIQIIGRAREAGIHLTARDLFEHQTVAELAQVATTESAAITDQGLVTGAVPLTPIQRWFFELNSPEPHHFNQSIMLTIPAAVTEQQVRQAVGKLIEHHDALRAIYSHDATGWHQTFTELPDSLPVQEISLAHLLDPAEQRTAIEAAANECQRTFDLANGPLIRVLLMRLSSDQPARLLLTIHHLVVDGVSWRILTEDLQSLFAQIQSGAQELDLPRKSTSYRQWAEWLITDAIGLVSDQEAYWYDVVTKPAEPLPSRSSKNATEAAERISADEASVGAVESVLDAKTTEALLTTAHVPYRTQVNDLLLTALTQAVTQWSGDNQMLLALEGHGRTDLSNSIDLSRTVGWFTNQFPLSLHNVGDMGEANSQSAQSIAQQANGSAQSTDMGQLICSIKEQLRAVPNSGVGYSILRYLNNDPVLNNHTRPEILFNYLGQAESRQAESRQAENRQAEKAQTESGPGHDEAASGWSEASESVGDQISPAMGLIYPLEINGSVIDGSLSFEWSYDTTRFDEAQIAALADAFNANLSIIVAHCAAADTRATPSDYPLATVTQAELDRVMARFPTAEAIYDGTPAQAGMLFESQLAPNSGVYILQSELTLAAELEPARLRHAFAQLIQRHSLLRTAFVSLERQVPLQVVLPGPLADEDNRCPLPWTELDWRTADDFSAQYDALVAADQQQDFAQDQAPLMRVTLIHAPDGTFRLLWTMHHVITDGWSTAILFNELIQFYRAGLSDSAETTADDAAQLPAIPFERYVAWLQQQQPDVAAEFWRDALQGISEPTMLFDSAPFDTAAQAHAEIKDASYIVELGGETFQTLEATARREHITLSTVVQGAWSLLLNRYSQRDDLVVGVTVSGRPADLVGAEDMVGMFLNILPLRLAVEHDADVWVWLRSVQERYTEADRFSYMPLAEIQKQSELPPSQALFESLIIFQNYPVGDEVVDAADADGDLLQGFDAHEQTNFPITLFVNVVNGDSYNSDNDDSDSDDRDNKAAGLLGIDIQYDANRFDEATIARVAEHLKAILRGIAESAAARPDDSSETTVRQLTILSSAEEQQLLTSWNETDTDYPRTETLVSLFDQQLLDMPDATALIDGERHISYAMLNAVANQIAQQLVAMGVGRETLVGVSVERSPSMVAALLGILKAGGAYVPLDPSYPAERLNYMLTDSGAQVLIVHAGHDEAEQWYSSQVQQGVQILDLAALASFDPAHTDHARFESAHEIRPENLAYVIYTSGSTGQPKGVEAMHRGAMNRLYWMWNEMPFAVDEVAAQKTALSFVDSVWEIFGPLLQGVPSVTIANDVVKDPEAFIDSLTRHDVSRLVLVPSLLQAMLDTDDQLAQRLPHLTEWICSGETLTGLLADRFQQAMPHARMINLYGSSEVAGDVTWFDTRGHVFGTKNVPIGHPIANTQIYLLDRQMHPVPLGAAGEIYVGGENVARGYHNQDALTAERFVDNPFGEGKLYYMADWGRYRPDGTIEFLGRRDGQVKIRGFRVELGEVESALQQQANVRDAVVVAHRSTVAQSGAGQQLVAYIVPASDDGIDQAALRNDLLSTLPDYMIPTALVALDEMPLLPNGKVNRLALPALDSQSFTGSTDYAAPTTPMEERLIGIWAELLDLDAEQIGIHHDFFALGGHSLVATQVINRIRNELGVDIALRTVFEAPTVAELAAQLQKAESATTLPPLTTADRSQRIPLSFAQERLWFLMMYDSSSVAYNMPNALRLSGTFEPAALEVSIERLIARHESLRTIFPLVDGDPVQEILAAPSYYSLPIRNVSHLAGSAQEAEAERIVQEEAVRPFDIEQGPLFRILLITLAEDEHILFTNMHHIITDGWSGDIFIQELITLYQAQIAGTDLDLPPLPIQYADYAVWQRSWLDEELLHKQLGYWKEQLADAPTVIELSGDRPRPLVPTYQSQTLAYQIGPELVQKLEELSRQNGATLFMTLLSAFGVLLHRYSRQDEVVIGSPVTNRNHPDLEGVIGFFVNTLALRIDMTDTPSFAELLARVHSMAMDGYANQDAPFAQVVESLPLDRNANYNPVYQVMFALQNSPSMGGETTAQDALSETGSLRIAPVDAERGSNHHDLMLLLNEDDDGVSGTLEFNLDIFDAATVERMLDSFTQLLESIVQQPTLPIDMLNMLPDEQRSLLLDSWGGDDLPYPSEKHVAQLFEEQAEQRPDAVALLFDGQAMTYAELNAKANQLAYYLLSQRVSPGARIGLCTERSFEMVIATLGILKAGCVYVPLDPSYPQERLHFMIADTEMELILVQEQLLGNLGDYAGPLFNLDSDLSMLDFFTEANVPNMLRPQAKARGLAYIMYTSGSTGQPKGAAIPHQAIVRLVKETNYMALGPEQTFIQLAPTAFDAATLELWGPLLNGGRLVIMPPGQPSLAQIADALVEHKITALFITTALFNMMVDEHLDAIVRVLQVLTGGETATVEKINRFVAAMPPGHRLVHVYGPTENTTFTTGYPILDSKKTFTSSVPIGRPISHTTTYVLDEAMQPVPVGMPGELYTGGDGVGLGYWNRPELTAERFVDNPFGAGMLYRTGDLVRYLPDGNIDFMGRIDAQVKIRGHRIELGEIEHHLAQHPDVQQVVVLAREDVPGEKVLVAYIVPETGATWSPNVYRNEISESLPAYMVPNVYIEIAAIPINPNGKVDRKALPVPDSASMTDDTDYAPPTNYLEEELVTMWSQLFEMETTQIGIRHSFFELGGHSLIAAKNVNQIQEQFGVAVSLRNFFEKPTLAEIGDVIYDDLVADLSLAQFEEILAEVEREVETVD